MKFFNARAALGLLVVGSVLPLTFAAGAVAAQAPVPLGTAVPFAVLAGTQITNVPTSVISGDVGLSPAAGANIIGLSCLEVTGTIYKVDGTGNPCFTNDPGLLTTAKSDLTAAFLNAAAQTPTVNITGVNLAGQTYGAGVYNSTGSILISGPTPLTLDGGGNADAVFIFQAAAAGDLTVAPTSQVTYTNGAQPCNVFWKVQSAFLQNSGFGFVGTILALTQITATANITVQGRLLARNADVTLISDTITKPSTCVLQADLDAAAAQAAAAALAATEAAAAAAALVATEAARVEAANAEAAKAAETTRQAAAVATQAAAVKAAAVKAAAAKKAATAKKAAAAKKVAAAKKAAAPKPTTPTGGSTSVRGPALPPVNTAGFTG